MRNAFVKQRLQPGSREETPVVQTRRWFLYLLVFFFPTAFAGTGAILFLFPLPVWLVVLQTTVVVVAALAALSLGLRRFRNQKALAPGGIESFFLTLTALFFSLSLLAFFFFDLNYQQRIPAGVSAGAAFFIAALGLVVWVRFGRSVPQAPLRFPRLAAVVENVLLLLAGALLFACSFPGFVFPWGCGPLAYLSLAPVFIVINRSGYRAAALYGALYAVAAHMMFNFWLALFNPIALSVVIFFRIIYYVLLFLLLKLSGSLFGRGAFLVQTALWTAYEFISAQGFIAYSYGILGYSQFLFSPILQVASLASVWGVSLLVIFPGVYLGNALKGGFRGFLSFVKATRAAPIAYGAVFTAALVFGAVSRPDTATMQSVKVACVQTNIDPWIGGDPAYERSLQILIRLSRLAVTQQPDLVVWPETALVPALRYHTETRDDQERYNRIIRPFLEFMDSQTVPYLIGNNDRTVTSGGADSFYQSDSYNAVLYMQGREIRDIYHKTHLVPFTEHFPFRDSLPMVYDWLAGEDTHFYTAGGDANKDKVFNINGLKVSSLVCFEDTFGEISRRFAVDGAELLVNHSNDAWSHSEAAEMQHLAIAVFRAVETRRSLVRCTTSGITAVIDPGGAIIDRVPPFDENIMVTKVPVNAGAPTIYVATGEWCGLLAVLTSAGALAAGIIVSLFRKMRRERKG
jgi:apolipoprotein N-acyltransferase